jgi:hypothetical protein
MEKGSGSDGISLVWGSEQWVCMNLDGYQLILLNAARALDRVNFEGIRLTAVQINAQSSSILSHSDVEGRPLRKGNEASQLMSQLIKQKHFANNTSVRMDQLVSM